jgi:hypothetical protein
MSNAVKFQPIIAETLCGWTMEPQRPADMTPDRLDVVVHAFDVVVAGRSESPTAGRSEDGSIR